MTLATDLKLGQYWQVSIRSQDTLLHSQWSTATSLSVSTSESNTFKPIPKSSQTICQLGPSKWTLGGNLQFQQTPEYEFTSESDIMWTGMSMADWLLRWSCSKFSHNYKIPDNYSNSFFPVGKQKFQERNGMRVSPVPSKISILLLVIKW